MPLHDATECSEALCSATQLHAPLELSGVQSLTPLLRLQAAVNPGSPRTKICIAQAARLQEAQKAQQVLHP